ncbi:DUF4276 family protein [Agrobacterium bohemicum]|uniref:DUF4276 family protein n=1 Tax=Agrobacterium bohemicum TaxID=2052828 RepID=UPI0024780403|nr:DUF4276 family protein [Agrobacterium bohemicum]
MSRPACHQWHKHANLADRFIPFVAMHEFEGLLFSDPTTMAHSMGVPALASDFTTIRAAFETPEHINDSYQTAPSKRLLAALPGYQKVLHGNVAMIDIGLATVRSECPIFDNWLNALEQLVYPCMFPQLSKRITSKPAQFWR